MKIIKTFKKCHDCGTIIYNGVMLRTKYKHVKNNYYCSRKCFDANTTATFKWFTDFDLVEFVEIKSNKPIYEQIDISKGFEREA